MDTGLSVQQLNTCFDPFAGRGILPQAEERIIRHLLTAIDDDAGVSQRKLSSEMGIAVGSVNWYLKRCINKGLVKLQQVPMRRYAYFLTPKGFEEKARLTAAFLQTSFDLYRRGRQEIAGILSTIVAQGRRTAVLAGDGDLAEIALLASLDSPARIVAVTDPRASRVSCAGVPVVATMNEVRGLGQAPLEDIVLTSLSAPQCTHARVLAEAEAIGLGPATIHIPGILNFRPDP
jgi:DNA-binding MarR family transcriptional regulator